MSLNNLDDNIDDEVKKLIIDFNYLKYNLDIIKKYNVNNYNYLNDITPTKNDVNDVNEVAKYIIKYNNLSDNPDILYKNINIITNLYKLKESNNLIDQYNYDLYDDSTTKIANIDFKSNYYYNTVKNDGLNSEYSLICKINHDKVIKNIKHKFFINKSLYDYEKDIIDENINVLSKISDSNKYDKLVYNINNSTSLNYKGFAAKVKYIPTTRSISEVKIEGVYLGDYGKITDSNGEQKRLKDNYLIKQQTSGFIQYDSSESFTPNTNINIFIDKSSGSLKNGDKIELYFTYFNNDDDKSPTQSKIITYTYNNLLVDNWHINISSSTWDINVLGKYDDWVNSVRDDDYPKYNYDDNDYNISAKHYLKYVKLKEIELIYNRLQSYIYNKKIDSIVENSDKLTIINILATDYMNLNSLAKNIYTLYSNYKDYKYELDGGEVQSTAVKNNTYIEDESITLPNLINAGTEIFSSKNITFNSDRQKEIFYLLFKYLTLDIDIKYEDNNENFSNNNVYYENVNLNNTNLQSSNFYLLLEKLLNTIQFEKLSSNNTLYTYKSGNNTYYMTALQLMFADSYTGYYLDDDKHIKYVNVAGNNNKFNLYLYQNENFTFVNGINNLDIPNVINVTGVKMKDLQKLKLKYKLTKNDANKSADIFIRIYTKIKEDSNNLKTWYRSSYLLKIVLPNNENNIEFPISGTTNTLELPLQLNSNNYMGVSINDNGKSLTKLLSLELGNDDEILAISIQSNSGNTDNFTFILEESNLIYSSKLNT